MFDQTISDVFAAVSLPMCMLIIAYLYWNYVCERTERLCQEQPTSGMHAGKLRLVVVNPPDRAPSGPRSAARRWFATGRPSAVGSASDLPGSPKAQGDDAGQGLPSGNVLVLDRSHPSHKRPVARRRAVKA